MNDEWMKLIEDACAGQEAFEAAILEEARIYEERTGKPFVVFAEGVLKKERAVGSQDEPDE